MNMDRKLKNKLLFLHGLMVGMVFTPSLIIDFNWGKVISMLVGLVVGVYIINKD